MNSQRHSLLAPTPSSLEDFRSEAHELNMLKPNNFVKIINGQPSLTPRQSLIKCMYDTSKLNRSQTQAFILLLGYSGAGKSSTINHLFELKGKNELKVRVSDCASETRTIQEFKLQADYPKYALKDATLSVIDTPGFNDSLGSEQDEINLMALKTFIEQRFSDSGSKQIKPNLVYIIMSANDNRFKGKGTPFEKSLRFIKELNVVSTGHPNVICIMTNVCSIEETVLQEKKQKLREIIKQNLEVDAPVVFLENNLRHEALSKCGDFSILPFDTKGQLIRLFEYSEEILQKNKDSLAEIIFNACFQNDPESNLTVSQGLCVPAYPRSETDIQDLRNKMRMLETKDDVRMSRIITFKDELEPMFGKGYTLIEDKIIDCKIFEFDSTASKLGCPLPQFVTIQKCHQIYSFMELFESKMEYSSIRIKDFGIDWKMDLENVKCSLAPGCNIESEMTGHRYNFLTLSLCHLVTLNKFDSAEQLTNDFKNAVQNLPSNHSNKDKQGLENIQNFLRIWGDFFVSSVFMGGCVSGKVQSTGDNKKSFESIKEKLIPALEFNSILEEDKELRELNESESLSICPEEFTFSDLQWYGGDDKFHDIKTLYDQQMWKNWLRSIKNKPSLIRHQKGLTLISDIVKLVDVEKAKVVDAVIKMKYHVGRESQTPVVVTDNLVASSPPELTQTVTENIPFVQRRIHALNELAGKDGDSGTLRRPKSVQERVQALNELAGKDGDSGTLRKPKSVQERGVPLCPPQLPPRSTSRENISDRKPESFEELTRPPVPPRHYRRSGSPAEPLIPKKKTTRKANFLKSLRTPFMSKKSSPMTRREVVEQIETPHEEEGCFTLDSEVHVLSDGGQLTRKCLNEISIGDRIMSWNMQKNKLLFSPVIAYLDYCEHEEIKFLQITLTHDQTVTLTGNHLMLLWPTGESRPAQNLACGDCLYHYDNQGSVTPISIKSIEPVVKTGWIAPLTMDGTMIVDDILASCYCNVRDIHSLQGKVLISAQDLAHMALAPLRWKYRSISIKSKPSKGKHHIDFYVRWLRALQFPGRGRVLF